MRHPFARPAALSLVIRNLALAIAGFAAIGLLPSAARGATLYANPGDPLLNKINAMQPGDTLILNPGSYSTAGVTMLLITDKVGGPDAWFTIKAEQPGTVKILGNSGKNMCEIRNSAYWRFENLELDGRNLSDDGIKMTDHPSTATDFAHHIVLENLNIHNLNNACVNTQITVWDLTVRNCWLHDAFLAGYFGSPNHNQQILNLTFEHNVVERMGGYGIQVKAQNPRSNATLGIPSHFTIDSWGWLIKDNVWIRDAATADPANPRPNLLVDAAPASGEGSDEVAVIEGNVVLGSYADSAFQLSGNLRVVNNVIFNVISGGSGIRIGFHDITYPRHLEILNNTVFISGSTASACLSVSSVETGTWPQVIANNAFIRGNTFDQAVSLSVPASVIRTNNIVRGTGGGAGFTQTVLPVSQIFANPVYTPGLVDLYPAAGSPLIDAGSDTYAPAIDFNGVLRPRGDAVDVGAYEVYTPHNPGWPVEVAFKQFWVEGDVDGDGEVSMLDITSVVAAFGATPADANWNTACDVDNDREVSVLDIVWVVMQFGQTRG